MKLQTSQLKSKNGFGIFFDLGALHILTNEK